MLVPRAKLGAEQFRGSYGDNIGPNRRAGTKHNRHKVPGES